MTQKLALKRLTASDLTIFRWHFHNRNAGNQKAINLNADIFINRLYPSIPIIIEKRQGTIPLDLNIYGPGLALAYNLQRKIQKGSTYKNYRLNGEFIADPDSDPNRFHSLQPGDFVIFDFVGDLEPSSARAVFIASDVEVDQPFHASLEILIGNRSMIELQLSDLQQILASVSLPEQHPANLLILGFDLEDAAMDGIAGVRTLRSGPHLGRISRHALEQARGNAQRIGRLGEELLSVYLQDRKDKGLISDFTWDADENAISPYDFSVIEVDGSVTLIDVKSTTGNFDNRIHISYNELLQMRTAEQYDLYRVYALTDNSMMLRIAKGLKTFAESIVAVLQQLPSGVQPDSVSVNPIDLHFGNEIRESILDMQE
jgi:hypothetical protein